MHKGTANHNSQIVCQPVRSDMSTRRSGINAAFEISLAQRAASAWPAFFAPIGREAVANQPRLDARISQHRAAGGSATVKIGEIVGFE